MDVYRLGWIYDFPDAINGLELWTCDSGNNNTNYCDQAFDDTVAEAKATQDTSARTELYGQLEDMLFGEDGAMPILPIYWYTYPNLEKESIKETFFISPLDQIDFTKVEVQGVST